MLDFNIEYKPKEITSFSVGYDNKIIHVKGNRINEEAFSFIKKAKKNSFVVISHINFEQLPNVDYRKIEPLLIKLDD